MSMRLYDFQKEGVRALWKFRGRALLSDEMGLGKTIQALEYLRQYPNKRPAVIVCPASLKWYWAEQVKVMIPNESVTVLSGHFCWHTGVNHTLEKLIVIVNYDILDSWADPIIDHNCPNTMILDEAHYVKNTRAKRRKAAKRIAKGCKHVIALTGTPILSRPNELWSIIDIVNPNIFGNRRTYQNRYCDPKVRPWLPPMVKDYSGASNLPELHEKLRSQVMIRRTIKEVSLQLPDKIRTVVPFVPSEAIRNKYDKANKDFYNWLMKIDKTKAKKAKNAEHLVKLGYLRRLAIELKQRDIEEWIKEFFEETENEKLVLFAIHRKTIKWLEGIVPNHVTIHGGTSQEQRKKAVKEFQENPKVKTFIGQLEAAGQGLTLTAANTLAFVEMGFVPGKMMQAENRIYRIGQKKTARIYYLIAAKTIEEKICKMIQKKQKVIERAIDGIEEEHDLNLYAELMEMIKADFGSY